MPTEYPSATGAIDSPFTRTTSVRDFPSASFCTPVIKTSHDQAWRVRSIQKIPRSKQANKHIRFRSIEYLPVSSGGIPIDNFG